MSYSTPKCGYSSLWDEICHCYIQSLGIAGMRSVGTASLWVAGMQSVATASLWVAGIKSIVTASLWVAGMNCCSSSMMISVGYSSVWMRSAPVTADSG